VSKSFPGQRALDEVSLEMRPGEIHGLLGENGSGKSTLIKVLSGYHAPDPGGRVLIHGEELQFGSAADSNRLGLRFVHQHLGIINQLTAVENVALASGYDVGIGRPINLRTQARRTQQLLDRLGVEVDLWRPLGECRAIDRTVVAIARALDGLDPERGTLVLDEPTAALPPDEVENLFTVVRELTRRGVTTIYVSHRLDEVFELVDRVSVLRDGRMQGTRDIASLDRASLVHLIVGSVPERYLAVGDVAAEPVPSPSMPPSVSHTPPRLAVRGLRSRTLQSVDFEVDAGEVLGIAGLLGSGREELAAATVGAIAASVESISLDGEPHRPLDPVRARRAGIALVPGNRGAGSAVAAFDVRENITLANLEAVSVRGRIVRSKELGVARRWIDEFELRPRDPALRFSHLSGGNQQKAILARWFNIEPKVVLLDDPTGGVDVGAREAIYELIRAAARTGAAFVVCSSDHEDLVELCARVIVLRRGTVAEVLERHDITADRLLRATMGDLDD
jgi:ribose transport system ATP-binding protein